MTTLKTNAPIGFFDSGVGGLTVLKEVKKLLPNEKYIYFGDSAHVPYGDKSKEQLLTYSDKILQFFEQRNCKAVVMACNTTSSVIYNDIKNKYRFKIYPIVQTVAKELSELNIERLGIFATRATINSKAYSREIAKYNQKIEVFEQYCPDWVQIVENNSASLPENIRIIKNDLLNMLANKPEKIVLGCTHYPYLLDVLDKFAPESMFIDPAISFSKIIKSDLTKENLLSNDNNSSEEFYVSGAPDKFKVAAKTFYDIKSKINTVRFD